MTITTGTAATRTQHSTELGTLGVLISMGVPVAIVLIGIIALGWGAIAWLGAIVWGIVAAFVLSLFMMVGKALGVTRIDFADLLGSMFAPAHSDRARRIGAFIHHVDGALLAIAWAYGSALAGVSADWASGLVWGVILWALSLLMLTSIGAVHPRIRSGEQDDPGTAATNFGSMTPLGSLFGHLVYGALLGLLYAAAPLA